MRAEFGTSSGWQQLEGGSKGAGTNHPAATVMQLAGKGAFEAWVDPRRHKARRSLEVLVASLCLALVDGGGPRGLAFDRVSNIQKSRV
jgi:hypothetical protein